jgi:transposase
MRERSGEGRVEEVTDEPLYRDRVCGIDIGKAGLVATIRVPSDRDPARRAAETRSFGTTKREVLALADWLRSWQVPAVVMEATGDYWKGPFYRLEAEGFECVLADAKQVKNLPGRPKRDPADSRWLAACFERGAITSCFVATPEFRIIRLHTRYRRDLTEERTREKQRAEKLLESAQLTELRGRIAVSGGSARGRAARFPAHDQRRGWAAGSVVAEGAALGGG